jgi:Domain of unknown function (DUF4345)
MTKLLFKIVAGVLAGIPIVTGFIGTFFKDPFFPISIILPEPALSTLDNEWRFMSAIWLSIGVCFLWMLPQLEKYAQSFQMLLALITFGGIGRAILWALHGTPSNDLIFFTLLELIVCPLLVLWLRQIVKKSSSDNHELIS